MSNSFKASNELIDTIKSYYKNHQEDMLSDVISFKAVGDGFSLLIYYNGTVFFQGKKASEEASKWNLEELEVIDHVGSDEVGCGDYFGPVVVCSTLVKKEDYDYLKEIGVKDSKQLNDDTIRKIAPLIKQRVKTITFVLTNKKYNELYESSNFNLNKIKAYAHNFVLYKIVNQNNFNGKIVVDQFCEQDLYYSYLNDYKNNDIQKGIYFTTKAENKYLAVACASIVARATFLDKIDEMSKEIGHKVILGASSKVDDLAKTIVSENGFNYLTKYVKVHFKNTKNVLDY